MCNKYISFHSVYRWAVLVYRWAVLRCLVHELNPTCSSVYRRPLIFCYTDKTKLWSPCTYSVWCTLWTLNFIKTFLDIHSFIDPPTFSIELFWVRGCELNSSYITEKKQTNKKNKNTYNKKLGYPLSLSLQSFPAALLRSVRIWKPQAQLLCTLHETTPVLLSSSHKPLSHITASHRSLLTLYYTGYLKKKGL